MTTDEAFNSIHKALWNSKQPNCPQKDKDCLQAIKQALKQTRNGAISDCLTILKESRAFGMEEEIIRIENLKEKL